MEQLKTYVQLKENAAWYYKPGMNEVEGLEEVLRELFQPVVKSLAGRMYWNENLKPESVEYKSRDGFIPHSHNCGGLQIFTVIPECESYNFSFLEFGTYEPSEEGMTEEEQEQEQEALSSEGHLDAGLRIWFKFEGFNEENGKMKFYIVCDGGNGDAPYFRHKHLRTFFETEFECKTLSDLKRVGSRRIKKLIKVIE